MSEAVALVNVCYQKAERELSDDSLHLRIPTDGVRGEGSLTTQISEPGIVRDALLTVGDVLASDLRFKARDRSDYLAHVLAQGGKVTQELWDAQKKFLEEQYGEAAAEEQPLDPIATISSNGLAVEVFSADESAYARLDIHADGAFEGAKAQPGTTYVAFTPELLSALSRVRSYRKTSLELSPSAADQGEARALRVPYRWIRAFGQVQAASTLPANTFNIAPVDLYNVLFTLRMQRAKTPPRALRYELVPGEKPRLILEPWDIAVEATGEAYAGKTPVVVRTWGRRRLMALSRVLPHAKSITVHLVGGGLPAFYVVDLGCATLTLALSGWTDSGWAGIATFDLLAGEGDDEVFARKVLDTCGEGKSLDELSEKLSRDRHDVRQAVIYQMQRGLVVHDMANDRYIARKLFSEPLDADALRYRDEREAHAHRLLADEEQVKLTKVHDLGGEGVRIEGTVDDAKAHRSYETSFTIDREGRTVDASCTSPQFRRAGLREGPTVPMIALRLLYSRQKVALEKARDTPEGRKLIHAETRVLTRRDDQGTWTYRLSLDERRVVVRWGVGADAPRVQQLWFSSTDEARDEYFGRMERLMHKGYIDASAAEMM